ncbi:MAG: hypothetical protein JWQ55_5356, partial [Rhodopila sp.]|nr:hypothetical protein [Rhodopila sp.]
GRKYENIYHDRHLDRKATLRRVIWQCGRRGAQASAAPGIVAWTAGSASARAIIIPNECRHTGEIHAPGKCPSFRPGARPAARMAWYRGADSTHDDRGWLPSAGRGPRAACRRRRCPGGMEGGFDISLWAARVRAAGTGLSGIVCERAFAVTGRRAQPAADVPFPGMRDRRGAAAGPGWCWSRLVGRVDLGRDRGVPYRVRDHQ